MPENTNQSKLSNYSLNFDGNTATNINVGNITAIQGASTFSIAAWINVDSTGQQRIFGSWVTSGNKRIAGLGIHTNNKLVLQISANGSTFDQLFSTSTIASAGTWYHVAVTFSSGTAEFYIDGASAGTDTSGVTTVYNVSSNYFIGSFNTSTTVPFDGRMDQVCVFDYALSTDQITYLYNLNDPMAITGTKPTAYYSLGANSNPEIAGGYPNLSVGGVTPYSNYSINFDRAGSDRMNTPAGSNGILSGATSCSVSVWFNLTTTTLGNPGLQPFVTSWVNPSYNYIYRWYNGALQFYLRLGSTTYAASYTWTPTTGVWHHTVGTYDGSIMRLYLDGVEVATNGAATGTTPTITISDSIGIYASVYFMDGPLSNIAYWKNTTLTPSEITEIYNSGVPTDLSTFSGTAPNVWYPMDGKKTYYNGSVIVARDAIGTRDMIGSNLVQENIVGNAPGSSANGTGVNIDITDLKGDMSGSTKNSYSINMADYGDPNSQGVTPADSGRTTSVPG